MKGYLKTTRQPFRTSVIFQYIPYFPWFHYPFDIGASSQHWAMPGHRHREAHPSCRAGTCGAHEETGQAQGASDVIPRKSSKSHNFEWVIIMLIHFHMLNSKFAGEASNFVWFEKPGLTVSGMTPMNGFSQDRLSRTGSRNPGIVEVGTGALNRAPTCSNYKGQLHSAWYLRVLEGPVLSRTPRSRKGPAGHCFLSFWWTKHWKEHKHHFSEKAWRIPNESSWSMATVTTLKSRIMKARWWNRKVSNLAHFGTVCLGLKVQTLLEMCVR